MQVAWYYISANEINPTCLVSKQRSIMAQFPLSPLENILDYAHQEQVSRNYVRYTSTGRLATLQEFFKTILSTAGITATQTHDLDRLAHVTREFAAEERRSHLTQNRRLKKTMLLQEYKLSLSQALSQLELCEERSLVLSTAMLQALALPGCNTITPADIAVAKHRIRLLIKTGQQCKTCG